MRLLEDAARKATAHDGSNSIAIVGMAERAPEPVTIWTSNVCPAVIAAL